MKCGVELESFGTILRLAKSPGDMLTLKVEGIRPGSVPSQSQAEMDRMSIILEDEKNKRLTEFDMKLIKFDETKFQVPKMKSEKLLCMRSSDFSHICRDLENISDVVLLKFIERGISLSVESDIAHGTIKIRDNDTMEKEEEKNTDNELLSAVKEGSLNVVQFFKDLNLAEDEKQFSLKYLNIFNKGDVFNPIVKIHFSAGEGAKEKEPMMLEFKIGDIGVIQYYLAPKITE